MELEVEDHGSGFVVEKMQRGIGLVAMRERAELIGGTLAVTPRPQGGTQVRLEISFFFLLLFHRKSDQITFHLMQALRQSQNPLCLRRQQMTKGRKALHTCQKMTKRSLRVVL